MFCLSILQIPVQNNQPILPESNQFLVIGEKVRANEICGKTSRYYGCLNNKDKKKK
ncbi:hypothetical protein ACFL57_00710 [Candidatus Margulisiibacteriota bacterium]